MARDYLAIQGSAAVAECSFSSSGLTDVAKRAHLGDELFGEMQELKGAYRDGCLTAKSEAWLQAEPLFDKIYLCIYVAYFYKQKN